MISLHKFNSAGNEKFKKLFESGKTDELPQEALKLSQDDRFIETLSIPASIRMPKIRMELGEDLWKAIGPGTRNSKLAQDETFWNWLSARIMKESLEQADGAKVGAAARWVVQEGTLRSYRQLPSSCYLAYANASENPAGAWAIMCQPVAIFSEVIEQVLSTRSIAGSVGVELATRLYFDPVVKKNKPGSSTKGPGTPRRLRSYLNQIKLTVDYKSLDVEELLKIIPREFDRFVK